MPAARFEPLILGFYVECSATVLPPLLPFYMLLKYKISRKIFVVKILFTLKVSEIFTKECEKNVYIIKRSSLHNRVIKFTPKTVYDIDPRLQNYY